MYLECSTRHSPHQPEVDRAVGPDAGAENVEGSGVARRPDRHLDDPGGLERAVAENVVEAVVGVVARRRKVTDPALDPAHGPAVRGRRRNADQHEAVTVDIEVIRQQLRFREPNPPAGGADQAIADGDQRRVYFADDHPDGAGGAQASGIRCR